MGYLLLLLCFTFNSGAADVAALMKNLVDLRGELESLNQEMESTQKEHQGELDLWISKRLELESSLQKETLRKLQLTEKSGRLASRVRVESHANPQGKANVLTWISDARAWVDQSLPFRRDQRLQTLSQLRERTERGVESLEGICAELWQFYENEFKMAGDNEYRIIDIPSSNGLTKVEAARLGLFSMFALTTDGQVQQAVRSGQTWTMTSVTNKSEKDDIMRLIHNLKSKKDSGLYNLPISSTQESL